MTIEGMPRRSIRASLSRREVRTGRATGTRRMRTLARDLIHLSDLIQ